MNKQEALDQNVNPDGISKPLSGLDDDVWDRGYCCETDDGTWYEMYAAQAIRDIWGDFDLSDPDEAEMFEGFRRCEYGCHLNSTWRKSTREVLND